MNNPKTFSSNRANSQAATDAHRERRTGGSSRKKPAYTSSDLRAMLNKIRCQLSPELQSLGIAELEQMYKESVCKAAGVTSPELANRIHSQAVAMRGFGEAALDVEPLEFDSLTFMREIAPSNVVEAMLAVQMNGTHEAAVSFLRAAGKPGISERQRDKEIQRAHGMMRLFDTQMASLMKWKDRYQKD